LLTGQTLNKIYPISRSSPHAIDGYQISRLIISTALPVEGGGRVLLEFWN
jgi:hypothetical protein